MSISEAEVNFLKQTAIKLFKDSYQLHQQLGNEGKVVGSFNQFGETSLKADWEAEEVFINGYREAGIQMMISSEEHGEVIIGDGRPEYRGVLDGIDGTNAYKMDTGRYGTMFAIFEGINPRYKDYLISGILEYPSGRLLIATKGKGAFIIENGNSYSLQKPDEVTLDPEQTRIFIDGGFEFNRRFFEPKFRNFRNAYVGNIANQGVPWGASSMYYYKLATGEADVVLECTRKRNLEIAVAFGILNEKGAVVVDENGESIGDRRYLDYGQGPDEHLPIISAATKSLADAVVRFLKS